MGNTFVNGDSPIHKRWHSTQTQFSFSSTHSAQSVASLHRPWSRKSRKNWHQSTASALGNQYESSKTAWPIPLIESLFLPEFPVRGKTHERNFEIVEKISKGAFGSVLKVRNKLTREAFAMKVLSKAHVIMENAIQQCKDEVTIQSALGHHPFIVQCRYKWQNRKQLFILTDYVNHGELLSQWKDVGQFPEEIVRIYVAELALTLDFLHNAGVVYRDLKMENILLNEDGHVQLIDFGLAKWLSFGNRAQTICGTIQYMAPEILNMEPYNHSVDWWSLGIIMYALLFGCYPIESVKDHNEMRHKVTYCRYEIPEGVSVNAGRLIKRLLCKDPQKRMHSIHKLKLEPFFKDLNFGDVLECKVKPKEIAQARLRPTESVTTLWKLFEDFPWVSATEVI